MQNRRDRGSKEAKGYTKHLIIEYIIEHWDYCQETDLKDWLKEKLGISHRSTVKKHLDDLETKQYIKREYRSGYSNITRLNIKKLYDIVGDYETFGKYTRSLLSFMQQSEEVLGLIQEFTKPESNIEFLKELIRTNHLFFQEILRYTCEGIKEDFLEMQILEDAIWKNYLNYFELIRLPEIILFWKWKETGQNIVELKEIVKDIERAYLFLVEYENRILALYHVFSGINDIFDKLNEIDEKYPVSLLETRINSLNDLRFFLEAGKILKIKYEEMIDEIKSMIHYRT